MNKNIRLWQRIGSFALGCIASNLGFGVGFSMASSIALSRLTVDPLYVLGYAMVLLFLGGIYWLIILVPGIAVAFVDGIDIRWRIALAATTGVIAGCVYYIHFGPMSLVV